MGRWVRTGAVGQLGHVGVLHLQAGGLLAEAALQLLLEHVGHAPQHVAAQHQVRQPRFYLQRHETQSLLGSNHSPPYQGHRNHTSVLDCPQEKAFIQHDSDTHTLHIGTATLLEDINNKWWT